MRIRIDLESNPSGTAQQKGTSVQHGRVHHYEKANVRALRQLYHHKIFKFLHENRIHVQRIDGPVRLSVLFNFSIKQKSKWGMPKDTRPDCDNIVKLLQDVLTDLEFWNDDGQIAMLQVCKFYAEKPSVIIDVEPYIALRRDEP